MQSLTRSWALGQTTFSVMRRDPEMLAFPVLSAFFSILLVAAFLVPTVFLDVLASGDGVASLSFGALEMVLAFVLYFALAFLSTFFNVCVVYTAKTRFEGGNATFFEAVSFAVSRTPRIVSWSVVAATIGLLLRQLDSLAERDGIPGLVFGILRGLLGFAWSLVQLFVVPVMVYEDVGPIEAMKRSAATLRETWGESLARHFGLGLLQFLTVLPIVGLFIGSVMLMGTALPVGLAGLALSALVFVVWLTFFNVANTVFNTALYHYASTGEAPEGFEGFAGSAFVSR
ncbi:MAG: hypothetical protein KC656_11190 [Myxococcales bacterium]|nr:hypothetical protein [Myxococcales bacterium]